MRPKTMTLTIVCAVVKAGLLERLASISSWRIKMRKKRRKQQLLMLFIVVTLLALAGTIVTVQGQDVICCNGLYGADGNWIGAGSCKSLALVSAQARAKACNEIRKLGCCPQAAEVCGDPSLNCTTAPTREGRPRLPNPSASPSPDEPTCSDPTVTPTITIDLGDPLNIDETPEMPEIQATAKVSPPSTNVTWTAQITYKLRSGACSGGPQFDSSNVTGEGETFTPDFGAIYGGKLEIKAKTTCGRGAETTITRDVGGLNADPNDVRNEIGTMDSPFEADDLKKIACHESRQRQFTGGNKPTLGSADDVGIMQICYQRTLGDVWNWKTNIARGRGNVLAAAAYSRSVPLYMRRGYYMAGGKRKPWLPRGNGPFPNATDFTPEQLRLEAIKRYNAGYLPDVAYWEWDDAAGVWVANPQGGGDPNYVANVVGQNANCP